MQPIERPSLFSEGTDADEMKRWKDPLFGSKMSLVWLFVVTGAGITLLTLTGRQRRERTLVKECVSSWIPRRR